MQPISPRYRHLAHRVLELEAAPGEQPPGLPAAERACARLREGLAKLVGPAGVEALLRRALFLARAECPLLGEVQAADGICLKGLAERAAGQGADEVLAVLTSVFGHFLWLLGSFIGEDLASRQVRRIWPEVPLDGAARGSEEALQ